MPATSVENLHVNRTQLRKQNSGLYLNIFLRFYAFTVHGSILYSGLSVH